MNKRKKYILYIGMGSIFILIGYLLPRLYSSFIGIFKDMIIIIGGFIVGYFFVELLQTTEIGGENGS